MGKFTWLIAAALLVGLVIFFQSNVQKVGNNTGPASGGQKIEEKIGSAAYSTSTILQSDSFYKIKAEYPQFMEAGEDFNDKIKALVAGRIAAFKQEAKDNWDSRNATLAEGEEFSANPPQPFDFIASWKQTQANGKYISFVIEIGYYLGGASGNQEVYAFNYDVAKKKEISISDFLGGNQQALQKLSALSESKVATELEEQDIQVDQFLRAEIKAGTAATLENFKDFNFTKDSLIIYFQKYQVAPGAAGAITITLNKTELAQNSIAPDYLK